MTRAAAAARPVLRDRDQEIALVAAATERARSGAGTLLAFTGPIGAGRSALLDDCARRAADAGALVLRARCVHVERGFPFGVAGQLFGAAGPGTGPSALAVMDVAHPGDGTGTGLRPAFGALRRMLDDLTADRPGLLLVDDLSWCDESSLRWLGYLARRLESIGVVVVVTLADAHRPESPDLLDELLAHADQVRPLAALGPDAVDACARAAFGAPVPDAVGAALHEVTAGTPLFLDAILAELAGERTPAEPPTGGQRVPSEPPRDGERAASGPSPDAERASPDAERVRGCRPVRLRDRLAAAIRLMPDPARRHLTAIAAIGDVADADMLDRLARLDRADALTAADAARRSGLLVAGNPPRLRHPVVADALDVLLPAEERRRTHLAAAELLRDCGVETERIAVHLLTVATPSEPWLIGLLRDAASRAARRGASDVAARYLRHALLAGPSGDDDRAALLLELAILERGTDMVVALRRILQAASLLRTAPARAEALCRISPLSLEDAPASTVATIRAAADDLARSDDPDGEHRDLARRLEARLHYAGKDTRAGLVAANDRLDELERTSGRVPLDSPGDRELAAVLMHAAALSGHRSAARVAAVAREVLARETSSSEHVHTPVGLCVHSLCMSDGAEVLPSWLEVALDHTRSQRAPLAEGVVRAELAAALLCTGRLPEARAHARRSFDLLADRLVDDSIVPGVVLAPLLIALDEPALVERLVARYRSASSLPAGFGAVLHLLYARTAADAGDLDGALEYCLDAGRRFERAGQGGAPHPWRAWAIDLHRRLGRPPQARELAERELARAREWASPTPLGRALRVLGELTGTDDGAGPLLDEAVAVLRGGGDPTELGRALDALAEHLERAGDRTGAAAHRREAERIVTGLCGDAGAPREVTPVTAPAADRARPLRDLTRSERRIAALAARGRTNHEIAGDLNVSVRAVEKHLTGVYRKLGVPGRAGLTDMWPEDSDLSA